MSFKDLAHAIVRRGGKIIPLFPNSKAPNTKLAPDGAKNNTKDPLTIAQWDRACPEAGVGWVATTDTVFFVEEDELGSVPADLFTSTFTVETGSGKLHRIIKHSDATRSWGNYSAKKRDNNGKPQETFSVRTNMQYCASIGTIHPDTKKPYFVKLDVPIVEATEAQLNWLNTFMSKEQRGSSTIGNGKVSARKLHKNFSIENMLEYYGIEYKKDGNKYHVHTAKQGCPAAQRVHKIDGSNSPRAIEQCSFIWDEGGVPGFVCLSGACYGKTFKDAHSAIIKANFKLKPFQVYEDKENVYEKELMYRMGKNIRRKRPEYLWDPYLALGRLVHLMGMSGEGKSPVTIDIAARVTAGKPWPDGAANLLGPSTVILMNLEDEVESVIMPRFDLAGGNDEKLCFIEGTRLTKDSDSYEASFALDTDMELLANLARSIDDLAIIIIDPITNYLGKRKMNAEDDVRAVLTPLASLAQELGITVMNVGHMNKRESGTNPLHRAMGAAAFVAVSRETYMFGPDPDSEDKHSHVMAPTRIKSNPGIKYKTYAKLIEINDKETGEKSSFMTEGIEWGEKTSVDASELADPETNKNKSKNAEAAEFLRELLSKGKLPVKTCLNELRNAGYDTEKLDMTRIRKKAGASSSNEGKNSTWYLATAMQEQPKDELDFVSDTEFPVQDADDTPDEWEAGRE